jgi:hypothetical protein
MCSHRTGAEPSEIVGGREGVAAAASVRPGKSGGRWRGRGGGSWWGWRLRRRWESATGASNREGAQARSRVPRGELEV